VVEIFSGQLIDQFIAANPTSILMKALNDEMGCRLRRRHFGTDPRNLELCKVANPKMGGGGP
jgi:hypothetical protein